MKLWTHKVEEQKNVVAASSVAENKSSIIDAGLDIILQRHPEQEEFAQHHRDALEDYAVALLSSGADKNKKFQDADTKIYRHLVDFDDHQSLYAHVKRVMGMTALDIADKQNNSASFFHH